MYIFYPHILRVTHKRFLECCSLCDSFCEVAQWYIFYLNFIANERARFVLETLRVLFILLLSFLYTPPCTGIIIMSCLFLISAANDDICWILIIIDVLRRCILKRIRAVSNISYMLSPRDRVSWFLWSTNKIFLLDGRYSFNVTTITSIDEEQTNFF